MDGSLAAHLGCIEGGGTKFRCAVMTEARDILAQCRVPTTTPERTLASVIEFFQSQAAVYPLKQVGLASFGPLRLASPLRDYGGILLTPKPDWSNVPLAGRLSNALHLSVVFDTDVNAAALAEYLWGSARGSNVAVYVTIGTGIGGGIIVNGRILNGIHHPEVGHMLLPAHENDTGHCPFHRDCVEGLASGLALQKTWHQSAETLPEVHPAWQRQAGYIGALCHNLLVTLGPDKIILGGGVTHHPRLIEQIIRATDARLNRYLQLPVPLEQVIVAPELGDDAGLFGALALALGHGEHCLKPDAGSAA